MCSFILSADSSRRKEGGGGLHGLYEAYRVEEDEENERSPFIGKTCDCVASPVLNVSIEIKSPAVQQAEVKGRR